MKKIIVIIFLLQYINIKGQSIKNGIITYKINVSEISIKNYFSTKREKIRNRKVIKYWDNYYNKNNSIEAELKFKGYNSAYKLKKKVKNENNLLPNTIEIFSGGKNIYYTNYIKNENIKLDCYLLGDCFLIKSQNIKWKLTQTMKIIKGYECFKAETITKRGNKEVLVEAWYTSQIPVNFGPLNYFGLPGLILELNDGNIVIKTSKILLNSKSKIEVEFPKKGIKISEKEFLKLAKKLFPKEMFKN